MTILYQTISRLRPLHYCLGAMLLGFLVVVVEANTYYVRDLLYLDVYGRDKRHFFSVPYQLYNK